MGRPKKIKDQHTSKFMVRLPETYRAVLERLTKRTRRAFTVEVQMALDKHFESEGETPPNPSANGR